MTVLCVFVCVILNAYKKLSFQVGLTAEIFTAVLDKFRNSNESQRTLMEEFVPIMYHVCHKTVAKNEKIREISFKTTFV